MRKQVLTSLGILLMLGCADEPQEKQYASGCSEEPSGGGSAVSSGGGGGGGEPSTVGATYVLTSGIDNLVGTNGNDTFTATAADLGALDSIDGGSGTDTLSIVDGGTTSVTFQPASLNGVEVVSMTSINSGSAGSTFNLLGSTGVTTLRSSGSTLAPNFSNVGADVTTLEINNSGVGAAVNFTASAFFGSADSKNIKLTNMTGGTISMANIETLNIESYGSSNTIDTLSANGATTINISGDATLSLADNGVATRIISTNSAGLTLISSVNSSVTINGGSGADVITRVGVGSESIDAGAGDDTVSLGSNLGSTDTVVGGDGTDTLSIEADLSAVSAIGVSGFETVQIGGSATTLDVYPIRTGLSKVILSSSGSVAVSNAGADITDLVLDATASLSPTFTRLVDTSADTLTVTVDGADAATTALTANNEETITVTSDNASAVTISTLTAVDLTSLTATGSGAVTLSSVAAALLGTITLNGSGAHSVTTSSLSVSTINASGATGSVTVSASSSLNNISFSTGSGSATITTGSGADTLTAGSARAVFSSGAGADTLTGGAGDDDLTGGTGNDTISTGTGTDNVTGGAGTDTITLGTGNKTIYISAGDSTTTTAITSISPGMSVAGADVITGVNVGDTIVLQAAASDNYSSGVAASVSTATADNDSISTTAVVDNSISFVRGVYSSNASLFSASSSGSDVLMTWDDNSSTSGQTYRAMILKGSIINNATVTSNGNDGLTVVLAE